MVDDFPGKLCCGEYFFDVTNLLVNLSPILAVASSTMKSASELLLVKWLNGVDKI